jgi:hypothetical protein
MRVLLVGQQDSRLAHLRTDFLEHNIVTQANIVEVNCCEPLQSIITISRDQPDIVCIDTESFFALESFFLHLQTLYPGPSSGAYFPILIGIIPHETNREGYLDLGFDLVFEKPVQKKLFFAQVNAYKRRLGIGEESITSPHLLLNTSTQDIYLKTSYGTLLEHLRVSPVQFALLKIMVQQPRAIWSRDLLTSRVASEVGDANTPITPGERTIDRHIYKIRRSLESRLAELKKRPELKEWNLVQGYKNPFIHTSEGWGYFYFDAVQLPDDVQDLAWGNDLQQSLCSICRG